MFLSDQRLIIVYPCPETDSCLVDVTLACEDANSKLVDVVTVAEVDDEQRIANILVEILTLKIVQDIEVEVWSRSRS